MTELLAPFAPARISGYDFGAPMPPGGWTGTGQSFGWLKHLGSDYGTKAGEPIIAPESGSTTFEQGLLGYGNKLTLTLLNGWKLVFGHVAQGSNGPVRRGGRIGTTGHDIGSSQGSVTLVEVHDPSGNPVNPHSILDPIFRGGATAGSLFGAASEQLFAQAGQSSVTTSTPATPGDGPNVGAAWDALIKNLQAGPAEAAKNTEKQVQALKPIGDFFGRASDLLKPKPLWRGFFVGTGIVLIAVGILIYFKGDDMLAEAKAAPGEAAEAGAAVAAPEAIPEIEAAKTKIAKGKGSPQLQAKLSEYGAPQR